MEDFERYATHLIVKNVAVENVHADADQIENDNLEPVEAVGAFSSREKAEAVKKVLFKDDSQTTQKDDDGYVFTNKKTSYTINEVDCPGYKLPNGDVVVYIGNKTFTLDALEKTANAARKGQMGEE